MLDVYFARGIGIDDYYARKRLGLAVVEDRFGLSLPRSALAEDPLPVYAIMGSSAPDFEEISAWAEANDKPLPDPHLRLIPAGLRREYELATDPEWWQRGTHRLTARAEWSPHA